MQSVDLVLECGWVIPVVPRAVALREHAVVVDQGKIIAVTPIAQAQTRFQARAHRSLPHHALTAGFINSHSHAAMALLRGCGDDLPLMPWLQERIWPLEQQLVSERFVYDGTRLAALDMLSCGTTTVSDMYFFPQAAARALRDVGLRAVVGLVVLEFPSAYATDADDYLAKGLAAHDALRDEPLVGFTMAPHAPYTVSDQTFARVRTLAEELDLPIHIHVQESAQEVADSLQAHGVRPLQRLERLGLVNERLLAVHCVHLNDHDIALLQRAQATMVHCPASNLKLASGIAPIGALLAANVNVALGTDGAASNNRLDLLDDARLAALLAKGATSDARAFPAAQVLEALTINAARGLNMAHDIGSIEVGKQADLVAIDMASVATTPCFDPISQIIYAASRSDVSDVWIAGTPVVQKRQMVNDNGTASSNEILSHAAPWQNRIQQFLSNPVA